VTFAFFGHRADFSCVTMRALKWKIIADMMPPDRQTSEEESRWLKLGDDALHNRGNGSDDGFQLNPGSRAVLDFEKDRRDTHLALEQVQQKNSKNILRKAG
jgi:hypothetical protein